MSEKPNNVVSFGPERRMLDDLARSGLDRKDAERMQLKLFTPSQTKELTGHAVPAYKIPYLDVNGEPSGFFRVRYLADVRDRKGKKIRYWQPPDSVPQAYFPPGFGVDWAEIATDPKVILTITEGEKKAAKACKEGIDTIGLGGVWNFQSKDARIEFLDELADFDWAGRKVEVCFDGGDVKRNPHVRYALRRLTESLENFRATVVAVELPRHLKLDEYLVKHTVAQYRNLPRMQVAGTPPMLIGPEKARAKNELDGKPYEPPVIVNTYLLQAAGGFVGPGGLGKSTVALYESVHIILGRPLYGCEIVKPGAILYVTAEDDRNTVLGRLNWICRGLSLSKEQTERVRANFYVEDLSAAAGTRLATVTGAGQIVATEFADELLEKYAVIKPSLVTFDPTSLIGPGESFGNDGFAELMRIGRYISNGLAAAVRFVHHVSQTVARADIADQYAGRGGTAFADNSRMNHQLRIQLKRTFESEGVEYRLLAEEVTDEALANGAVIVIFRHKISYQKRERTPIALVREAWAFRQVGVEVVARTPEARAVRAAESVEKIVAFVREKLAAGVKLNATTLTAYGDDVGLSRRDVLKAVAEAIGKGALVEEPLPKTERKGRRATYLRPIEGPL
jgi:regulatory protein RepA